MWPKIPSEKKLTFKNCYHFYPLLSTFTNWFLGQVAAPADAVTEKTVSWFMLETVNMAVSHPEHISKDLIHTQHPDEFLCYLTGYMICCLILCAATGHQTQIHVYFDSWDQDQLETVPCTTLLDFVSFFSSYDLQTIWITLLLFPSVLWFSCCFFLSLWQ